MQLLLHLSGVHPGLPLAELQAAFAATGTPLALGRRDGRILSVTVDGSGQGPAPAARQALSRLALTHEASVLVAQAPRDEEALLQAARARPEAVCDADGSPQRFLVRAEYTEPGLQEHGPGRQVVERVLGQAWSATAPVDLERPGLVLRAWITRDQVLIGRRLFSNDPREYRRRAPKERPYFSPVSGDPVIMRAVANLARVPPGGLLYDPLVGTGGILLEAGLAGMRVAGSDNDPAMVQGARENLQRYGVTEATLFLCDVREAEERFLLSTGRPHADGIATDLPYGQSSTTGGASPVEVASWTLHSSSRLLRPGGRLVVGTPDAQWLNEAQAAGLAPEAHYDVRVHKSLTRSYFVFRKEPNL